MSSGKLIVISGASGVGKGTVLGIMMQKRSDLSFSVSATTRAPREGEIDGFHYYFVSREYFEKKIAENRLKISQLGTVSLIPINKMKLTFDTNTGQILSIFKD